MKELLLAILHSVLANPDTWAFLVFGVFSLLKALGVWKDKKSRDAFRRLVPVAFDAVNELKHVSDSPIVDKVAEGMQTLERLMTSEGVELTEALRDAAKDYFRAMHFKDRVAGIASGTLGAVTSEGGIPFSPSNPAPDPSFDEKEGDSPTENPPKGIQG